MHINAPVFTRNKNKMQLVYELRSLIHIRHLVIDQ